MKLRSLLSLAIVLGLLSSCGVGDLEDRLDKVEHTLGTDEPIKIDFKTTNSDNQEVAKKTPYSFKTTSYYSSYAWDYGDGEYYIYIERYSDVFGNEEAYLEFYYDANTGETSSEYAGLEFRSQTGQNINPYFSNNYAGHTVTVDVKSFNQETGAINVEVDAATDETAENNEFAGKPMTSNFTFKGKLEIFVD